MCAAIFNRRDTPPAPPFSTAVNNSIETTLKYYVEQDADDVADELWRSYPPAGLQADRVDDHRPSRHG